MPSTLYETCQPLLRRARQKALSWLPFPYCFGPAFSSAYRSLRKTQWYPPGQLEDLQWQRLKALIRHAYENVPYYRRLFEDRRLRPRDFKEIGDLQKLPVLTKEEVRKNVEDLKAVNARNLVVERTSGSSGVPLKFYLDPTAIKVAPAFIWRHWSWAGYRVHDRCAIIKGQREFPENAMWYLDSGGRHLVMSSLQLVPKNVGRFVERLRRFDPHVVRAYPSTAYILAEYMRNHGIGDVRPKCVITSSETLFGHQRGLIESQFRCRVFDYYGMAERVAIIGQCAQGGYHINSEYGIVEILTDDCPAGPGESGHIVATGFTNYGMPLIRYDTGDIASPSDAKCSCGRGLPLIASIEGRIRDVIVTPSGRHVPSTFVPYLFYPESDDYRKSGIKGIAQYQVVQEEEDLIVVRIVSEPGFSRQDFNYIIRNFAEFMPDVRVQIELVDQVTMSQVGKRRLVMSRVSSRQI